MADDGDRTTQASDEWLRLLEQLKGAGGRTIIIGSGDTGKTTLTRWLTEQLARVGTTAWVDADVGQSQVGPPATIGWRLVDAGVIHSYFVGDVSPVGRPAAVLSGLLRAVCDSENSGAKYTVVDTTGFVAGHEAVALKTAKVEMLAPVDIVVIGDDRPIQRLLKCWQNFPAARITRLSTVDVIRAKSAAARREHRSRLFAEALAGAQTRWVTVADKALVRGNSSAANQLPDGLLLGFVDTERRLICLGLLQALDVRNRRLLVHTHRAAESAAGIIFGAMALTTAGEQLDLETR